MKLPKKVQVIDNWPDMKLFFDSDRKEIISLCSQEALSIKDLSVRMGLNPGSIHNHVTKLFKAGYLAIGETREINGIIEKKYVRSAESIDFAELKGEENTLRNKYISKTMMKESFNILENGDVFSVRLTDVKLSPKKYKEACAQLKALLKFLKDNNRSGDLEVQLVSCLGKLD
ncbi:MAG: DNA-binding transcriptional ArsR family regulator [Bacteriovoracaceae bacterium]|jgi:DNA-binding transcriptional ArsR family regulator